MRSSIGSILALTSLAFASVSCSQPRTASTMARDSAMLGAAKVDKAAEEQAIRDLSGRWMKMFADRDTAGIAALFAADGYEMPPNSKAMKGPDEVSKGLGEMLRNTKDFKISAAPSTITIADAGDLAVERGTYQASFTGPKGKKIEDHGNYVTVYRKLNGQWKVIADINASELPGAM